MVHGWQVQLRHKSVTICTDLNASFLLRTPLGTVLSLYDLYLLG